MSSIPNQQVVGIWDDLDDSWLDVIDWDAIRTEQARKEQLDHQHVYMLTKEPIWSFLDPEGRSFLVGGIGFENAAYLGERWAENWWPVNPSHHDLADRAEWSTMRDAWMVSGRQGATPVGVEAIRQYLDSFEEWDSDVVRRFADAWAPFDDDESAAVIVSATLGRSTCTAFCLAKPIPRTFPGALSPLDETHQLSGDVRFHMRGQPDLEPLTKWRKAVADWWASTSGVVVRRRGGRPAGRSMPLEDVRLQIQHYVQSTAKPTKAGFAYPGSPYYPYSNDTLTRTLAEAGTNWQCEVSRPKRDTDG